MDRGTGRGGEHPMFSGRMLKAMLKAAWAKVFGPSLPAQTHPSSFRLPQEQTGTGGEGESKGGGGWRDVGLPFEVLRAEGWNLPAPGQHGRSQAVRWLWG